jgi:hypothetical protein
MEVRKDRDGNEDDCDGYGSIDAFYRELYPTTSSSSGSQVGGGSPSKGSLPTGAFRASNFKPNRFFGLWGSKPASEEVSEEYLQEIAKRGYVGDHIVDLEIFSFRFSRVYKDVAFHIAMKRLAIIRKIANHPENGCYISPKRHAEKSSNASYLRLDANNIANLAVNRIRDFFMEQVSKPDNKDGKLIELWTHLLNDFAQKYGFDVVDPADEKTEANSKSTNVLKVSRDIGEKK